MQDISAAKDNLSSRKPDFIPGIAIERIVTYDPDRHTKAQERSWQAPDKDLNGEALWDFQYSKAVAWLYDIQMTELLSTYDLRHINAVKQICQEFGITEQYRAQAKLRLQWMNYQSILSALC